MTDVLYEAYVVEELLVVTAELLEVGEPEPALRLVVELEVLNVESLVLELVYMPPGPRLVVGILAEGREEVAFVIPTVVVMSPE